MKILVVNDDGYTKGVNLLVDTLKEMGHIVHVMIPDRDRSGSAASITIGKDIKILKISDDFYKCTGTPVDCTHLGVSIFGRPDLVFSGINLGVNLADDVMYSGTYSAAKEASLFGIKSVAMSYDSKVIDDPSKLKVAIEKTLKFIETSPKIIHNVNIPVNFNFELRECSKGARKHFSSVDVIDVNKGIYRIGSIGDFDYSKASDNTDFLWLNNGFGVVVSE